MKGYAYDEIFRPWMREVHVLAVSFVDRALDWDNEIRCHELARAVAKYLNKTLKGTGPERENVAELEVVDGKYGGAEHSWLKLGSHRFILDPYAVGRHPLVQLVDSSVVGPRLYEPGRTRVDIRDDIIEELLSGN